MWSSAASLLVALASVNTQGGRFRPQEQVVWQRLRPSIATLLDGGRPVAAAALIDEGGLFVAAKSAVKGKTIDAELASGRRVKMNVLNRDGATGFALLQADPWEIGVARPFRAPSGDEQPGGNLLAVLSTGPIRVEFVSGKWHGVQEKSRRLLPMSELRFEAPAGTVGEALIVCENGELVGVLSATLKRQDDAQQNVQQAFGNSGVPNILRPQINKILGQNNYGPGEMTVAYTVGPAVVRRVLDGFRSPSHKVIYPSLGVFCLDSPGGGAVIQSVKPESAAAAADFRPGDVIQDIAGNLIRNQVDFAKTMLRMQPGAKITVRLSRNGLVLLKDVTLGQVVAKDSE